MRAAANYMDEREHTQLYCYKDGQLKDTNRYEVGAELDNTQSKYQQHIVITTELLASKTLVDEPDTAQFAAERILEVRPDAELHAIAIHGDGEKGEKHVHVHVLVGTTTTIRREQLKELRGAAYKVEQNIEQDNIRQLSENQREWVARNRKREPEQTHSRERSR